MLFASRTIKSHFLQVPLHPGRIVLRSSSVIPKAFSASALRILHALLFTLPTAQSRRQDSSESYAKSQGIDVNVQESRKDLEVLETLENLGNIHSISYLNGKSIPLSCINKSNTQVKHTQVKHSQSNIKSTSQ